MTKPTEPGPHAGEADLCSTRGPRPQGDAAAAALEAPGPPKLELLFSFSCPRLPLPDSPPRCPVLPGNGARGPRCLWALGRSRDRGTKMWSLANVYEARRWRVRATDPGGSRLGASGRAPGGRWDPSSSSALLVVQWWRAPVPVHGAAHATAGAQAGPEALVLTADPAPSSPGRVGPRGLEEALPLRGVSSAQREHVWPSHGDRGRGAGTGACGGAVGAATAPARTRSCRGRVTRGLGGVSSPVAEAPRSALFSERSGEAPRDRGAVTVDVRGSGSRQARVSKGDSQETRPGPGAGGGARGRCAPRRAGLGTAPGGATGRGWLERA